MAFQILYNGSGTTSPTANGTGATAWAPYGFNAVVPGFGAAIPATALPNYSPGCTIVRFVQNIGASGPITNGNLVVDVINNGPNTQGSSGTSVSEAGSPLCIVYTVAGGVLT